MSQGLDDSQAIEFFRRSYSAVDGLWFMRVEQQLGFEAALELDDQVWKVMPKIQARFLKRMTGQERGLKALRECLSIKWRWEGYALDISNACDDDITVTIRECPWYAAMQNSGRAHLAERVGARICASEYAVWAAEFGDDIRFSLGPLICQGNTECVLHFGRVREASSRTPT